MQAARAAERAARESYGRLLAYLAARSHDIALAEDALGDAFAAALRVWPDQGVPDRPEAWLLTTARNRITDRQRHIARFPTVDQLPDIEDQGEDSGGTDKMDEDRLALMMVCTHPAIAPDLHAPLMLQTVLGLDAKQIARLFLISPAALAKRLVRAKSKIRDAGIPFHIPPADMLPERSTALFEAIYALHAHDWLSPQDDQGEEALYLADLLRHLMPSSAEAKGLAALIAFGHARRGARLRDGVFVPLDDQAVALWDPDLIRYGRRQLALAHRLVRQEGQVGRFQIEAAIEAVHLDRQHTGSIDWDALNKLYFALHRMAPSLGASVAQAVVTAELHGAETGLGALDQLPAEACRDFQPYWAARADLLVRIGEYTAATAAFDKALSLTTEAPVIRFLNHRKRDAQGLG